MKTFKIYIEFWETILNKHHKIIQKKRQDQYLKSIRSHYFAFNNDQHCYFLLFFSNALTMSESIFQMP